MLRRGCKRNTVGKIYTPNTKTITSCTYLDIDEKKTIKASLFVSHDDQGEKAVTQ